MTEIDANHLSIEQAKFLIHSMKLYYLNAADRDDDEKFKILKCFSKDPHNFKHMDLVDQLKKDQITVDQFKTNDSDLDSQTKGIIIKLDKEEKKN